MDLEKLKTISDSDKSFYWCKGDVFDQKREHDLRVSCSKTAEKLLNRFSRKEQINIVFTPMVFNFLAWHYGEKARKLAGKYKILWLRDYSRWFDTYHEWHLIELQKDLLPPLINKIQRDIIEFIEAPQYKVNFMQFYYQVNTAYINITDKIMYQDMSTYAIMSILLIMQADKHNERVDKIYEKRIGVCNKTQRMFTMNHLMNIMWKFAGDMRSESQLLELAQNNTLIKNTMSMIENKVCEMDFDLL